MICSQFKIGQGLGNMLHEYVAVRCLALDKGYEYGFIGSELFKGKDFMNLDFGVPVHDLLHEFNEKKTVNEQNQDVREYDPLFNEVEDFTLIEGYFQDERYFIHHLDEIREWLKVEPIESKNIINFRGGEYVGVKDLFLPQEYWNMSVDDTYEVHTDDPETARKFFPNLKIVSDIGINWRSIRYAKNLVLSNSSFAILPALLNENAHKIIAPLYWAGYNKRYWQLPQNNYKKFTYIHHDKEGTDI